MTGALVLTFIPSSAEQLDKTYSVYADDARVSASKRLYDGEQALRVMARKDMISRRIVGATTIAIGAGLAVLAVWRSTLTESTSTDRMISGTLAAASSVATVGAGISQLWFQRGSAEIALAHWEASSSSDERASVASRKHRACSRCMHNTLQTSRTSRKVTESEVNQGSSQTCNSLSKTTLTC